MVLPLGVACTFATSTTNHNRVLCHGISIDSTEVHNMRHGAPHLTDTHLGFAFNLWWVMWVPSRNIEIKQKVAVPVCGCIPTSSHTHTHRVCSCLQQQQQRVSCTGNHPIPVNARIWADGNLKVQQFILALGKVDRRGFVELQLGHVCVIQTTCATLLLHKTPWYQQQHRLPFCRRSSPADCLGPLVLAAASCFCFSCDGDGVRRVLNLKHYCAMGVIDTLVAQL